MLVAGIDMGAKATKVMILRQDAVLSQTSAVSGRDKRKVAEEVLNEAVRKAGISRDEIDHVALTGFWSKHVAFAGDIVEIVGADARAAVRLFPSARTVIDIGAEDARVVKCDAQGKVIDFALADRCAAGTGMFVEAMARALEVPLDEMGPLSLKSTKAVPVNTQCTVFAESEVVSLIHAQATKEDISRAVHDGIASRAASMVHRIGLEKDVVLVGGLARNVGFVDSLKRFLKADLLIPEAPEYVTALGAALTVAAAVAVGR